MKRKLVITTEIISPYRIPVFNALAADANVVLHVIFLAENDPTMRQWKIYKDEICFSYEVLPHWRRRVGGYNVLLNQGMTSALKRQMPDVIVCGGYSYLANWQLLHWARHHNTPVLLWSESNQQDRRRRWPHIEILKQCFYAGCSGVVVPGKSAAAYASTFGVPRDRIFIAPNAVDNSFFTLAASQARENSSDLRTQLNLPNRYFLYVGRLIVSKGVYDLLDAYALLVPELRAKVGLVFVGDGIERSHLERRAGKIEPGVIRFAGFAQREQLAEYYALADAFVFPTHTDPWGLVVNEAMASGLPIVATDAGGCVEDLVQEGLNGFVVAKGSPQRLSKALSQIAVKTENIIRLGMQSANIIDRNSPEACAAGFVRALNEVSTGHPI